VIVQAYGAGAQSRGGCVGGKGGGVKAVLQVTSGVTLNVYVGGRGIWGSGNSGGGNGGGRGSGGDLNWSGGGGGGGGGSDIRLGGTSVTNRIIVAGGGGGAGLFIHTAGNGGDGGYPSGGTSAPGAIGGRGDGCHTGWTVSGGSQTGGGMALSYNTGQIAQPGTLGQGETVTGGGCGGGVGAGDGCGYWGGQANSNNGGGGGGSSWVSSTYVCASTATYLNGITSKNGYIIIRPVVVTPEPSAAPTSPTPKPTLSPTIEPTPTPSTAPSPSPSLVPSSSAPSSTAPSSIAPSSTVPSSTPPSSTTPSSKPLSNVPTSAPTSSSPTSQPSCGIGSSGNQKQLRKSTNCKPCAKGTYSMEHDVTLCISCPIDTTTDEGGSSNSSYCKMCPFPFATNTEGSFAFSAVEFTADEVVSLAFVISYAVLSLIGLYVSTQNCNMVGRLTVLYIFSAPIMDISTDFNYIVTTKFYNIYSICKQFYPRGQDGVHSWV
jgi:hypothetical protein